MIRLAKRHIAKLKRMRRNTDLGEEIESHVGSCKREIHNLCDKVGDWILSIRRIAKRFYSKSEGPFTIPMVILSRLCDGKFQRLSEEWDGVEERVACVPSPRAEKYLRQYGGDVGLWYLFISVVQEFDRIDKSDAYFLHYIDGYIRELVDATHRVWVHRKVPVREKIGLKYLMSQVLEANDHLWGMYCKSQSLWESLVLAQETNRYFDEYYECGFSP